MKRTYSLKRKGATPDLGSLIGRVKDRVKVADVLNAFDLMKRLSLKDAGSEFRGMCPEGHTSASGASFSIDSESGLFHCWNCGIGGDIVALIARIGSIGAKDAARKIAEKLSPDLVPEFDSLIDSLPPEVKEEHERGLLYQHIFETGRKQLMEPVADPVRYYLTVDRGYDVNLLVKMEWIYWDTEANIRKSLRECVFR